MTAPPTTLIRLPHTGLQVPHTRFGMHRIKTLATHDGEAYTAELLLDGKPVGLIENTGTGGSTTWFPLKRDVLDWADMTEFAEQCRDEKGDTLHEEFVLAFMFDEFRTARDVARWVKQDRTVVRTVVRTLSALLSHDDVVDCTYPDFIYSIPNRTIRSRATLADWMWRQNPNAHDIEVWTGQRWEPLPKQVRETTYEYTPGLTR